MPKKQQPVSKSPVQVRAIGENKAEVLIYEQIGEDFFSAGVTAKQFAKDIKALGNVSEINVRINSVGGSVFEGLGIYNTLKNHAAPIVVDIDGVALSMASVIAMAGDIIRIAENGLIMIHSPQGMVGGNAKEIERYVQMLNKAKDSLLKAYVDRTGQDEETISQWMDDETWMDATEAKANGFADDITGEIAMAARADVDKLPFRIPATVINHFCSEIEEVNDMADDKPVVDDKPNGPVAATLAELKKALPSATSDFLVSQLEAESTLTQAQAAWSRHLEAQLLEREKELAEANAKLDKKPSHGVDPLVSDSHRDTSQDDAKPKYDDPQGTLKAKVGELIAAGLSPTAAMQSIRAKHPDLLKACGTPDSSLQRLAG